MLMEKEVFNNLVKVKEAFKYVVRDHFNNPIEVYPYKK
jgi:hypothetical protein